MKFVVSQDASTGLWFWQLRAAEGGSIARSHSGYRTREELLDSIHAIRAQAPRSLVFDLLGTLYEGV
ncbi:MAG: DUF1508 domain-containing protein [Variovorax sp.]|jgi:uncharacterized protein YegP (UPF0339 family)|nr:MAG: DUF1508 domain-containing protein [Variovorax sp.]